MHGHCCSGERLQPAVPVRLAPLIYVAVLAMGLLYYVPDLETPLDSARTAVFTGTCCC